MKVLFLQGHPSVFARDLGRALARRGHAVRHVTLNFGDWLYWRGEGEIRYRGSLDDWEPWLDRLVQTEEIDLLVYFADRHPYHVAAQRVARRRGITPLSYEFGYLRPDWITVERGGQSVHSHFPDRLEVIRALAATLPTPDPRPRYGHPHWREAVAEVAYHLGNALLWPVFPRFVADRTRHPIVEYLSYIPRNLRAARNARHAEAVVQSRLGGEDPFFVLALQMEGDYQIRANSRYAGLRPLLEEVITSFAADAPADARLVVKLHPMDNGLTNWRNVTLALAAQAGVADRVDFIDGGDLLALLGAAAGCIVVNSTVGLHALQAG
jgi:capsular polysaccharide export protein